MFSCYYHSILLHKIKSASFKYKIIWFDFGIFQNNAEYWSTGTSARASRGEKRISQGMNVYLIKYRLRYF